MSGADEGRTSPPRRVPVEAYGAALAALPGIGPARLRALVLSGSPGDTWRRVSAGRAHQIDPRSGLVGPKLAHELARAAARLDVGGLWEAVCRLGIRVSVLGGAGYPPVLAADHEAPGVLFATGVEAALDRPRVAIVGTRRATRYGRDVARELGAALAQAGVAVVSGLALGIDAAAHLGALSVAEALPVGVVGSGLDVVYPRANRPLWEQMAARGLLLSEAPPGSPPEAWRFPARNRILAALADALVVVESRLSGGSMHTVEAALARGCPVFAVPGPVRSPASGGTNRLLRDGASVYCEPADVLTSLGLSGVDLTTGTASRPVARPSVEAQLVLDELGWEPASLDRIVSRTGLAPGPVAGALGELESAGLVRRTGGWFEQAVAGAIMSRAGRGGGAPEGPTR